MINENSTKKKKVLAEVKQNGFALGYASKELRNDREVVLKALKSTGFAFEYASYSIQNQIVKEWIQSMEENN